jgi:hypothetical protein
MASVKDPIDLDRVEFYDPLPTSRRAESAPALGRISL